ncbi:phage replisome organizer N-terminal domain-containing protein [Paraclostridium bifermentans]|uniref:phage replisome organizer N-terminal domain-containing protein n=1 Tax=Paraclostridium bifermentans TaxID=1490 RepID=UPI00242C1009|nr:phage replisome organizer N-terminal domain-containing protein [Paraclostridium bifermentans]
MPSNKKYKKYYWLRLKEDFFRQKAIKKLRRLAGGDTFTIIYLKMLLLSVKQEGKLYFEGIEDNFIEELALELDEEVGNVKLTFAYLQGQKLIELVDEDEYLLTECPELIGKESESAERMRRMRAKRKKEIIVSSQSDNNVLLSDTEIEIEIEKETEIEIEKETEIEKEQMSSLSDEFCSYVIKLGFTLDSNLKSSLAEDIKEFGINEVKNALSITASKGKNYSYAKGILNNKQAEGKIKKGIKTFEDTRDNFLKNANEALEDDYNF